MILLMVTIGNIKKIIVTELTIGMCSTHCMYGTHCVRKLYERTGDYHKIKLYIYN